MPSRAAPYLAYADGACHGNPGRGGWGAVIVAPDGSRRELNGHGGHTTNNQMELTAAIEALRALEPGAHVILRSDSQYVINTMTRGWKRNANQELWRQLDAEAAARKVDFQWVRGHAGDELNERADTLATMGARGDLVASDEPPAAAPPPRARLKRAEPLAICAGCAAEFVATRADERYCNHARCQRLARAE
ncbi:MAG TPA: ribonuclease H [Candidatus Binataceae bacterium]|nr:ribonuclease H [Candidatus Binataceae bacterium]